MKNYNKYLNFFCAGYGALIITILLKESIRHNAPFFIPFFAISMMIVLIISFIDNEKTVNFMYQIFSLLLVFIPVSSLIFEAVSGERIFFLDSYLFLLGFLFAATSSSILHFVKNENVILSPWGLFFNLSITTTGLLSMIRPGIH